MLAGKRPHLSPLDYPPERVAELKAVLDRHGVACPVVAAYTDFAGMPAAEVPATELQIAYVESLCRIGRGLGASIVRVFTAYETDVAAAHHDLERESCPRCASVATGRRVTGSRVAIQNHHDVGVHTRRPAGTADRHRPAELQARVRRVVAGASRRGPVRDGPPDGPAHGHHDERRLRPAAAVPLPAGRA